MTTPVLEVTDLAIDFAQPRPAVNSISVRVDPGEVVALVGESGSGKSMTARAVLGLLPPGARATGSVRVRGREVLGAVGEGAQRGARRARWRWSSRSRRPRSTRCGPSAGRSARRCGPTARSPGSRPGDRAVELLRDVEMPDPERRVDYYPHQLSGGQKQRVVLALALANEPDLLLADEPTTALDVTVQAEILALLRRLRDRTGASILLITHNMGVVAEMADRVVVLKTGDVVEEADTATLFAAPRHPYTRQLLSAVLRLPEQGGYAAEPAADGRRRVPPTSCGSRTSPWSTPARHGAAAFTAAREVSLSVRRRRGARAGGGVRLRQDDAGPAGGRAGAGWPRAGCWCRATTWPASRASRLREIRRDLAFVHQDPAASLDPRLTVGREHPRAARPAPRGRPGLARRARVARAARRGPAARGPRRPDAARALRRAAAARRPRAGAGAAAAAGDRRRADQRARRVGAGRGAPAVHRAAGPSWASPPCSSATTSRWSTTSPTGWPCCATGGWSRPVRSSVSSRGPTHDYTRRLLDAVPVPDPAGRPAAQTLAS